ncbi:uncharacterized protein LOC142327103 [Lycorma delicatula]|uniref:uncharacterized protein LOC142327103 n=1 Tax=Lycorma delicatula TaxID=130591 RepID=UPI003F50F429
MIAKKREQYGPTSWPGNEQEKSLLSWCPDVISQSPSLYLMTAVLLLRFNCFMFAEMCFAKELELSKDHQNNNQTEVSILYYMAVCDYKQERFQQAISHLDNALHINWQIPQLHCLKGYCYYKLFEFDSSLESLNIVIHSENVQIDVHLTYLSWKIMKMQRVL